MRSPLVPPGLPLARTRAESFDELVLDVVEHLEERWATELASVQFAVEDVPPIPLDLTVPAAIPLARVIPASGREPAHIVIYRRPLEARATDRDDLGDIVHDIVVEQVAELLGLEPDNVDPGYGGWTGGAP